MKGAQRRRQQDEAVAEAAEQAGPEAARTPAQDVLAMQQTAGNQAVARMIASGRIARQAARAPTKGKAPPKQGGDQEQPAARGALMRIDGIKGEGPGGAIEILSWSPERGSVQGPGSGGAGAPEGPTKIHVTAKIGIHSSKLAEAFTQGKGLATVEIRMFSEGKPYLTISMKSVAVTSYQTSGSEDLPTETFTLEPTETKFTYEKDGG